MEKVTFIYIGVCIIHRSPSKFNGRGHPDTSLGSSLQFLAPLPQSLSSPALLCWASYEATGPASGTAKKVITANRGGERSRKKATHLSFHPPTPCPVLPSPSFLCPTLQVEFALSALQKDRTHRVQIVIAVTAQGASPSFCYLWRM